MKTAERVHAWLTDQNYDSSCKKDYIRRCRRLARSHDFEGENKCVVSAHEMKGTVSAATQTPRVSNSGEHGKQAQIKASKKLERLRSKQRFANRSEIRTSTALSLSNKPAGLTKRTHKIGSQEPK